MPTIRRPKNPGCTWFRQRLADSPGTPERERRRQSHAATVYACQAPLIVRLIWHAGAALGRASTTVIRAGSRNREDHKDTKTRRKTLEGDPPDAISDQGDVEID